MSMLELVHAINQASTSHVVIDDLRWRFLPAKQEQQQQQQQQQPFYPLRHRVFFPAKMNHLNERIIPHLGGRVEIHHFVVPIPRNPALLGQEHHSHGVPAPEDTPSILHILGVMILPAKCYFISSAPLRL